MSGKESRLTELLEPTISSLGFELWGLELISPNRRSTLRLYIEGENGVTVDDCAKVSRHVELRARRRGPHSGRIHLRGVVSRGRSVVV